MGKRRIPTNQISLFTEPHALDPQTEATVPEQLIARPDLLFNEINLLLLEGYVFSFSPKKYKVGGKYDFFQEIIKQPISVEFNPSYGQPGTLAYKIHTIIEQCVVVVNPRIVRSLFERHFICLNFDRMRSLDALGLALYKRLFYHLSNHLDPKGEWERLSDDERAARRKQLVFKKDYADICREWLGDLSVHRYRAEIVRQLGGHLDQLVQRHLLRKYEISRNAKDDGFNLVFYPGRGFFGDWEAFYGKKLSLELSAEAKGDARDIGSPLTLVAYFHQSLGHDQNSFPLSETSYALELLGKHKFDELKAFVDFSIGEARKTGFKMQRFNALKVYAERWFDQRTLSAERMRRKSAMIQCRFCSDDGYLYLEDVHGRRSMKICPHDVDEIARFCERSEVRRVEDAGQR